MDSTSVPRFMTLVTAPNDRFEHEAANVLKLKKRLCSYPDTNTTQGPQLPFRVDTQEEPYPYRPYYAEPELTTGTDGCAFTREEREYLLWSIITGHNRQCTDRHDGKSFPSECGANIYFDELVAKDLCATFFPVHQPDANIYLKENWAMPQEQGTFKYAEILSCAQPLEQIREYLGSHVCWYFAWMGTYTRFMAAAAVVGIVIEILDKLVPNSWTSSGYAVFVAIWTTVYLEYWTGKEKRIAHAWDVTDQRDMQVSPSFIKDMRQLCEDKKTAAQTTDNLSKLIHGKHNSDAFDKQELHNDIENFNLWYYPQSHRNMRKLESYVVTVICILLAFALSYQLFRLQEGRVPGCEGSCPNILQGILSGMLIPLLNFGFRKVAAWLTKREYNKTHVDRHRSLAIKEFVFKFVNAYASLFWIAFVRGDEHYDNDIRFTAKEERRNQLSSQLGGILITGQLISMVVEILVPTFENRMGKPQELLDAAAGAGKKPRKHKLTSETEMMLDEVESQMRCETWPGNTTEYLKMVRKRHFLSHLYMKTNILPRQARNKHRENSKKSGVFRR